MNIVLDTNIYVRDFLMNSVDFDLLLDYLTKTGSTILMPLIVYQELGAIYESKLEERLKAYGRTKRVLEGTLIDVEIPSLDIQTSTEVERYLEFVKKRLRIRDRSIVPFRDHYLDELVSRAIARRKPFSERGEEFRDALLWLTVLDIARETEGETLAFISNDARAFGRSHQLHQALFHEAEATGKQVNFYNSIGEFIEGHATQVEYITSSWLFSRINFEAYSDIVVDRLKEYLEDLTEWDLRQRGWEGLEFTRYLCATSSVSEENLTKYYVYEKSDGSFYVQANFYIEYEVEFNASKRVRPERYPSYSWRAYEYEHQYEYEGEYRIETKTIYECPEAEMILGVTIRDGQVVDIELSSWYL